MSKWQPIETAPKEIIFKSFGQQYGRRILAYPVAGEVARIRWWQSDLFGGSSNFIDDGGNAAFPTHWMPLPEPPETLERESDI